jgi:hypothetical protein
MKLLKNFHISCSKHKFGTTVLLSNILPNARNKVNISNKNFRFSVPTAAHNMTPTIFVLHFYYFHVIHYVKV